MNKFAVFLAAAATACAAFAQSNERVLIHTEPATPFVGQDFEVVVNVEADYDLRIDIGTPSDMPGTNAVVFGETQKRQTKVSRDDEGNTLYSHFFAIPARASLSFDYEPKSVVPVIIYVRRQTGIGTFTQSIVHRHQAQWPRFAVRDLPPAPDGFSGAIGDFTVSLSASTTNASPGDIVTLTATVRGRGNLNGGTPAFPALDGGKFKSYSPRAAEGDALLAMTMDVIPATLDATDIPPAKFTFFDPVAEAYRTAESKPIRLSVSDRAEESREETREVVLGADRDAQQQAAAPAAADGDAVTTFASVMRIAPNKAALKIADVPAGVPLKAIETTGGWIRAKVGRHTGWIHSETTIQAEQ